MVEPRQPRRPGLAEQCQVNRKGERAQPRIGADIARGALAPDVLLAGREGQHPAAPAFGVDGLADEPARHLPHELVAGREQTEIRPAEIERVAERLPFGGDNVGAHLAGRLDRTQGQHLGHDDNQQRALVVAGPPQFRPVAQLAPEIGVLHDDTRGFAVDEPRQVLVAARCRGRGRELEPDKPGIGRAHFAIMRMQPARQHRLFAAGDAVCHHHRLGAGGGAVVH